MADETTPRAPGAKGAPGIDELPDETEPTAALVREALRDTRELVRLEIALASEELKSEVARARTAAVTLGTAFALAVSGLTMCFVAAVLAMARPWIVALGVGGILIALGGVLTAGGRRALPRTLLAQTKDRLESDLKRLRERFA
jgi:hypothetical protein